MKARFVTLLLAGAMSFVAAADASAEPSGRVHAVLINGGERPESNYLSHLHHLEDMVDLLRRRGIPSERIHVFSADGSDPAVDLTTRDPMPADFWILEGTEIGTRLRPQPRLVDTRLAEVRLHAARRQELWRWFESSSAHVRPGDRLLLFVTDHGTGDAADMENGAISLWHEKLTVRELRDMLGRLPRGARVVTVMSQCYSGAFANLMDSGTGTPAGDVCGFFSTGAGQKAYGCYPEGRDRDKIGHAFEFIEALQTRETTAEAHADVLERDDTPDAPLRTSDAYLARLVATEAAARGVAVQTLTDGLLAQAWRQRAAWEPELRLLDRIGAAFGTFSPRSLAEVAAREEEIEAVARPMATYADTWKDALGPLKEAAVREFLRAEPEWRRRVDTAATRSLSGADRARLVSELLPALLAHARRGEQWEKLEAFAERARRAADARWRLDVRKAALQRMRTILTSVAGRVLARDDAAARDAVSRLHACEALSLGAPAVTSARREAPPSFPPLSAEIATLTEVSPSWLGVRFRAVTPQLRGERRLPEGANMLDAVYPGSPAERAGLQAGDIVVGTPGGPFGSPRELREWTLTAPRGVPLTLEAVRPGETAAEDRTFQVDLVLRVAPVSLPKLPDPPRVGEAAPPLPPTLKPVGADALPALAGRTHMLFFWATWCVPCKQAVPEVLALSEHRGLPVVGISDEDEETVAAFLSTQQVPFISHVAVDPMRRSFVSFGVSGTPTILLIDADGSIRHRQVGYSAAKGITLDGWTYPRR